MLKPATVCVLAATMFLSACAAQNPLSQQVTEPFTLRPATLLNQTISMWLPHEMAPVPRQALPSLFEDAELPEIALANPSRDFIISARHTDTFVTSAAMSNIVSAIRRSAEQDEDLILNRAQTAEKEGRPYFVIDSLRTGGRKDIRALVYGTQVDGKLFTVRMEITDPLKTSRGASVRRAIASLQTLRILKDKGCTSSQCEDLI